MTVLEERLRLWEKAHPKATTSFREAARAIRDALAEDAQAAADTVRFPPIRETVRRRPPAPQVAALTDRVELLEALAGEILRELRDVDEEDNR